MTDNINMKQLNSKKRRADNLAEYVMTFSLVGFVMGYALMQISPDTFKNAARAVFNGGVQNQTKLTLPPLENSADP